MEGEEFRTCGVVRRHEAKSRLIGGCNMGATPKQSAQGGEGGMKCYQREPLIKVAKKTELLGEQSGKKGGHRVTR